MGEYRTMKDVPMPGRIAKLPTDKRGLPIPVIVMRDLDGRPHFTVNDTAMVSKVIAEQRCSICGGKLERTAWFVGGILSAMHPNGAYIDPPAHKDCATYALKVCPFLAIRPYSKRIDTKTIDPKKLPIHMKLFADNSQDPDQPDVFVLAETSKYWLHTPDPAQPINRYLIPKRPWKTVQYWREGKQITEAQARTLLSLGVDGRSRPGIKKEYTEIDFKNEMANE